MLKKIKAKVIDEIKEDGLHIEVYSDGDCVIILRDGGFLCLCKDVIDRIYNPQLKSKKVENTHIDVNQHNSQLTDELIKVLPLQAFGEFKESRTKEFSATSTKNAMDVVYKKTPKGQVTSRWFYLVRYSDGSEKEFDFKSRKDLRLALKLAWEEVRFNYPDNDARHRTSCD